MKKIKNLVCILIVNLLAVGVFAQSCICPKVEVSSGSGLVKPGEPIVFTARISGNNNIIPDSTDYDWTVNGGRIITQQGATITVATENSAGMNVTATVVIRGNWCADCNTSASETVSIAEEPKATLFDKAEGANCEDLMSRTDNFFISLNNEPSSAGYILISGKPRNVVTSERQIRNYLKMRKYDESRITILKGGGESERAIVEMWLVPPGAKPPEPDFSPTETVTEKPTPAPTKPYIFSFEYDDGIGGCDEPLDLEGYAEALKSNPKSRGNIVILELSKTDFRKREKEILSFLTSKGIARKRLKTFHKKSFGGVELWILP